MPGQFTLLGKRAIVEMIRRLKERGLNVEGADILFALRPLPDLRGALRSHALIHTAEGEFFRDVLSARASSVQCPLRK